MTLSEIQEDAPLRLLLVPIVQNCVFLRNKHNDTIKDLAKWLDIDKRKIYDLEKLAYKSEITKVDIFLIEKILNYYNKKLILL